MAKDIKQAKDYKAEVGLFLLQELKEKVKYLNTLNYKCNYSFSIKHHTYNYNKHAVDLAIKTLNRQGYDLRENSHYTLYSTGEKENCISFGLTRKKTY